VRSTFKFASKTALASAALASLALPASVSAHAIWFAQRATQLALIYGVGADDLDAVRRMDKLTSVTGYDDSWAPVDVSLRVAGPIPVVDTMEPLHAVGATMDYGIWTKTPDGKWHNAGRDEHPDATISERTMKYAVHLVGELKGEVPLLEGHPLQVVPATAGIPQTLGEPMIVRVYYNGQPAENAAVLADYVNDPDQVPIMTDAQGLATIPVRNQGQNVVVAIFRSPTDDAARYESIEHRAALSFVLPHLPE